MSGMGQNIERSLNLLSSIFLSAIKKKILNSPSKCCFFVFLIQIPLKTKMTFPVGCVNV